MLSQIPVLPHRKCVQGSKQVPPENPLLSVVEDLCGHLGRLKEPSGATSPPGPVHLSGPSVLRYWNWEGEYWSFSCLAALQEKASSSWWDCDAWVAPTQAKNTQPWDAVPLTCATSPVKETQATMPPIPGEKPQPLTNEELLHQLFAHFRGMPMGLPSESSGKLHATTPGCHNLLAKLGEHWSRHGVQGARKGVWSRDKRQLTQGKAASVCWTKCGFLIFWFPWASIAFKINGFYWAQHPSQ